MVGMAIPLSVINFLLPTKTCFPSIKHLTPRPGKAENSEALRSHSEAVEFLRWL
uniref:Copper-transporting ATPase RAN1-like n=1 Tax=Rhizophora mucronata TaxID=61149 RepID=A0A2P2JCR5_RHIMU